MYDYELSTQIREWDKSPQKYLHLNSLNDGKTIIN